MGKRELQLLNNTAHTDVKRARMLRQQQELTPTQTEPPQCPAPAPSPAAVTPPLTYDKDVLPLSPPRRMSRRVASAETDSEYEEEDNDSSDEEDSVIEAINIFGGGEDESDDDAEGEEADAAAAPPVPPDDEQDAASKKINNSAGSTPDNALVPWPELQQHLESSPCPKCLGKSLDDTGNILWRPSLKATVHPWGAATDVLVVCENCNNYSSAICPTILRADDNNDNTRTTRQNTKRYNPKKSKFRDYAINYSVMVLIQKLGCGVDSIGIIFSYFGIAAGRGDYEKWKKLQDVIGQAEVALCTQVCNENIDYATEAYKDKAKEDYTAWESTEAAATASQEEKIAKMQEFLRIKDGRIGLDVGMDGAWQRRAIGFGKMNSYSGMNFCVDINTKRIINLVVYSKQCTFCIRWSKRHPVGVGEAPIPVPEHSCSQNYDPSDSSKSMEADAACLHKEDVELKLDSKVYIHTLCTDDDSSVRANTKYNLKQFYDARHGAGNWTKEGVGWPSKQYTHPRTGKTSTVYNKDYGHLNLQCYPIEKYVTDINHRVRVIAKGVFKLKNTAKRVPAGKLAREECYRLKGLTSLYLKDKKNRDLPFEEFCRRAPCMYLHHFNDHSCCDVSWCKVLQSTRTDGVEATALTVAYKKRFRDKETDWVTFKAVEDIFAPYLTKTAMIQCYHGHDTNKNESLNRKCSATAPKDRYFSGTMSLDYRFRLVVVHDSIGYHEGLRRLFQMLGFDLSLVCPNLSLWCSRLDNTMKKAGEWNKRPAVKKKRTEAIAAMVKAWVVGERSAGKKGTDYGSGIAITATAEASPSVTADSRKNSIAAANAMEQLAFDMQDIQNNELTDDETGCTDDENQTGFL